MTTPELVELGNLGNAAAGAAVTETSQWGADLHPRYRHRAFDGLPQLQAQTGVRNTCTFNSIYLYMYFYTLILYIDVY